MMKIKKNAKASIFNRGAGLYSRKTVQASTRVIGNQKPRGILSLNDLARKLEATTTNS